MSFLTGGRNPHSAEARQAVQIRVGGQNKPQQG